MSKDTYTIKELEILSDVKAATIRAWEKRFNLLSPDRTSTNIRVYNQENLRRLLQIVFLQSNDYKISKIANFTGDKLDEMCKAELLKDEDSSSYILELVLRIIDKDVEGFDTLYDLYLKKFMPDEFILGILEPLIDKLKKLWLSRSIEPYFEAYMLNHIFVRTLVAAEQERKEGRAVKEILIFQFDKMVFPVKLSLVYFLAAIRNYKIHYFFNPVSIEFLQQMKGKFQPDIVYTEINGKLSEAELIKFCLAMENIFPASKNIITGDRMAELWKKIPNKVYYIRNLNVLNKSM